MLEPKYKVRRIVKTHGDVVWRLYINVSGYWQRHNKHLEFDTEADAHGHAEVYLTGYIRTETHYA